MYLTNHQNNGYIYLTFKNHNLFYVLINHFGRVLSTKSAGHFGFSSFQRKSFSAIKKLFSYLINLCVLYYISYITLFINSQDNILYKSLQILKDEIHNKHKQLVIRNIIFK